MGTREEKEDNDKGKCQLNGLLNPGGTDSGVQYLPFVTRKSSSGVDIMERSIRKHIVWLAMDASVFAIVWCQSETRYSPALP